MEFDEYEKSVFLTESMLKLIDSLYTDEDVSFEGSEKLRQDLRNLICTVKLSPAAVKGSDGHSTIKTTDIPNAQVFNLPENLLYTISEYAIFASPLLCKNNNMVEIVPIRHDELVKRINNPFRGATKRRVLRLDAGIGTDGYRENILIHVPNADIETYVLKYLRYPNPIILTPLEGDLSIQGKTEVSECELCEEVHKTILENAVVLAMQRFTTNSKG